MAMPVFPKNLPQHGWYQCIPKVVLILKILLPSCYLKKWAHYSLLKQRCWPPIIFTKGAGGGAVAVWPWPPRPPLGGATGHDTRSPGDPAPSLSSDSSLVITQRKTLTVPGHSAVLSAVIMNDVTRLCVNITFRPLCALHDGVYSTECTQHVIMFDWGLLCTSGTLQCETLCLVNDNSWNCQTALTFLILPTLCYTHHWSHLYAVCFGFGPGD